MLEKGLSGPGSCLENVHLRKVSALAAVSMQLGELFV